MTDDIQVQQGDYEVVKGDVQKLISDVGAWISGASADAKQKWDETRPVLEEKLATTQAEAQRIGSASLGAANEMGKGFQGAFAELKAAFVDAKRHFETPEAAGSPEEVTNE